MDEVIQNSLHERLNRIREIALRRRERVHVMNLWDETEPDDHAEALVADEQCQDSGSEREHDDSAEGE